AAFLVVHMAKLSLNRHYDQLWRLLGMVNPRRGLVDAVGVLHSVFCEFEFGRPVVALARSRCADRSGSDVCRRRQRRCESLQRLLAREPTPANACGVKTDELAVTSANASQHPAPDRREVNSLAGSIAGQELRRIMKR